MAGSVQTQEDGCRPSASGVADGDPVLIDQDELLEREAFELNWCGLMGESQYDPDEEVFTPVMAHKNHWIETKNYWIYWKAKPTMGAVHPNGHIIKAGSDGPKSLTELEGERITQPFFLARPFRTWCLTISMEESMRSIWTTSSLTALLTNLGMKSRFSRNTNQQLQATLKEAPRHHLHRKLIKQFRNARD